MSNNTKTSDGSSSYEEAMVLTGYGKFNYIVSVVGGFAMMISLLATVDVTYILPASECELKLEKKDRGILSGAFFIGVVVSSHLLGFLSDTLGRQYILLRSLFMNIIIYIAASLSPNFWFLFVIRFITGFVLCGVLTCGLVYVGEFHSNKYRTRAVLFLSVLACLAFIYTASLGWLILPNEFSIPIFGIFTFTPWRVYYLVLGGVPSLIIGTIFYYLPESPKYLLACNKKDDALEILKKVYSVNTGNPKEQYPVKNLIQNPNEVVSKLTGQSKTAGAVVKMIWNQTYPLFMPPHLLNMLFSCAILFSLFYSLSGILIWTSDIMNQLTILKDDTMSEQLTFCSIVQSNWTANIERNNNRLNTTHVATLSPGNGNTVCKPTLKPSMFQLNVIIGLILSVTMLFATFTIPKLNRKAVVSTFCFSTAAVYLVLLQLPNIYGMIACLAAVIIFLNIIFCGTTTLLVDYFPTNYRGMAVCLAIMTGRLGSAVGGDIFSIFMLEHCNNMFYIAGALMIFSGICCISLRPPKINKIIANINTST